MGTVTKDSFVHALLGTQENIVNEVTVKALHCNLPFRLLDHPLHQLCFEAVCHYYSLEDSTLARYIEVGKDTYSVEIFDQGFTKQKFANFRKTTLIYGICVGYHCLPIIP